MTDLCGWSAVEIIGVVTRSDWDVWRSLFLNPNLILGLAVACSVVVARSPEWLRRERQYVLGRSLSLSYSEPLKIVRGEDIHLIDEAGSIPRHGQQRLSCRALPSADRRCWTAPNGSPEHQLALPSRQPDRVFASAHSDPA